MQSSPSEQDHSFQPFRRRRVLVCAFAVSPVRGSETAVGWQIASRLARFHDVTLLCSPGTHDPHRDEIETYLRAHPIPGLTVRYVESTPLFKFFDRKSHSKVAFLRAFHYVGYASWERAAFAEAMRLHREKPFDLVHQLNIVTYREPSYLYKMPIPFVWGPVAGASDFPWHYFKLLRGRDRLAYGLRNIANYLQKRFSLRPRRAARTARQIWVVGKDNHDLVTGLWGAPSDYLFEVGTNPQPLASVKELKRDETLRLVWAGYHVGRKALPIALRALAKLKDSVPFQFTLLGQGPAKADWQALSRELGIDDRIEWIDELPHKEALAKMASAHVFVFPSLQEASSTVVLEALSLGLPVLCQDVCGTGMVVQPECGIRVPVMTPEASIDGFAAALRRLAQEPEIIARLSAGALARSEELSWDHKALTIAQTYERIASEKSPATIPAGYVGPGAFPVHVQ